MSIVPKVTKKLAARFIIGLFTLAVLLLIYNWMRTNKTGVGELSKINTKDMILAIMQQPEGSQAVIIKPDGSIWNSPDYVTGKTDRDPAWRPDGNCAYFSSDREKEDFNVYRWNLMRNKLERRSLGSRSQLATSFGEASLGATNDSALITSGGFILALNPKEGTTYQVLPPVGRELSTTTEEGGVGGQFESLYRKLGTSFREAKWGLNREWIYAVMTGDEGQTLIAQSLVSNNPPVLVASGDRIDFDVNPKTGAVVCAVMGFHLRLNPDMNKDQVNRAREEMKIRHRIFEFDPNAEQGKNFKIIGVNKDDDACFSKPKVAPDGASMLVTIGKYKGDGNIEMIELDSMPIANGGMVSHSRILKGMVTDYGWHPTGKKIVMIKVDDQKKRSIFTMDRDGSNLTNVTKGKADFMKPLYSPQMD